MSVEDDKKGRPKTRGTYATEIEEDLDLLRDAVKEKTKSVKKFHQTLKAEYYNIKLEEATPYDDSTSDDPPRRKHPRRGRQKAELGQSTPGRKGKDKGTLSNKKQNTEDTSKRDMVPLNISRVFNNYDCYQIGDIVSVVGEKGNLYFCQIRGFIRDQHGKLHVSVRWLLPVKTKKRCGSWPGLHGGTLSKFNPMMFTEGPEQEKPLAVDLITFVMRPPPSLFSMKKCGFGFDANDQGWDSPTTTINSIDRRF